VLRHGGLELVSDLSSADWLAERIQRTPGRVGSVVPTGFEGYARLFHPAYRGSEAVWHSRPSVTWAEVARANRTVLHPESQFGSLIGWLHPQGHEQPGLWDAKPDEGILPIEQAAGLARVLAAHTATPDRCWFAVWDGWSGLAVDVVAAPKFQLPGRDYLLFFGPISSATQSLAREPWIWRSVNLWWPDDRAWCVATDIDLDSTYIGGPSECVTHLRTFPGLEVLAVDVANGITAFDDRVNPPPAEGQPLPEVSASSASAETRSSQKRIDPSKSATSTRSRRTAPS
jgi:hypothetical protein